MNCSNYQNMIYKYLDLDLSNPDVKSLENHLQDCSDCQKEKNNIEINIFLPLKDSRRATPPPQLWQKIEQKIGETKQSFFFSFRWQNQLLAGVSLIIVLIGGFYWLKQPSPPNHQINQFLEEQADFIAGLATNGRTEPYVTEEIYFGTDIEYYFFS